MSSEKKERNVNKVLQSFIHFIAANFSSNNKAIVHHNNNNHQDQQQQQQQQQQQLILFINLIEAKLEKCRGRPPC